MKGTVYKVIINKFYPNSKLPSDEKVSDFCFMRYISLCGCIYRFIFLNLSRDWNVIISAVSIGLIQGYIGFLIYGKDKFD